jgi:hypothetical protein
MGQFIILAVKIQSSLPIFLLRKGFEYFWLNMVWLGVLLRGHAKRRRLIYLFIFMALTRHGYCEYDMLGRHTADYPTLQKGLFSHRSF